MNIAFLSQCIAAAHAANTDGQFQAAIGWCLQALQLAPNLPEAWYNLGIAHAGQQQFGQARDAFMRTAALAENNPDAQNSIGLQFTELEALPEAEQCLLRALALAPDFAFAHSNLGKLREIQKRHTEAEASFRRALELQPTLAPAYVNLCGILNKQHRHTEAVAAGTKALELAPDSVEALVNMANALYGTKQYDDAETAARKALKHAPNSAGAWLILANTLIDRKRLEAAREACEKAQALDPVSPLPWLAAVALLRGESQFLAAETAARKAIQLDETLAAGWIALGDALTRLDQPREADKAFQRAYALDPEADWLRGMAIHNQMNACDWNKYAQTLPSLLRAVGLGKKSCTPFVMLSLEDSPALQHQAADTYVRARYPDHSEAGALPAGTAHDKLRLGYYSADFRNHAVSFLMAEIFELHDRDRFQVIGFDFGVGVPDEMRQRVSQAFDRFIHVHDQSDYEVAALSRDLGIDIAIDLGGHTQGSRTGIYADRAAPIQVNYLGYPGTMAAPFIDYILADSVLITPDTQPHYSEKVVYLPHFQANDSKRRISERIFTRAEVGLPKTGFAYCCFNATYKINPETFASWMRILKQVENAVLWLFEANQEAVHHLRHAAREHGIAPERLVFANKLPVPEYLARYRLADLFLDTLPYNAGTTASDALWAGLPVLTLAGQSFVSRMAASLLHAVGLPELITHSRGEYEALAIALANDSARLAEIRVRLAENRMTAPLFDAPRFTRHLEAAYRAMHERQQAGLPPDHILIEPIP